jgi:hypothetical protein
MREWHMSLETERATEFSRFAQQVKSFEKTLYGLVASSFVFSGISSIVHVGKFKEDPGIAAITLLVGTIGGVSGVLVTYVAWSRHPMNEFNTRIGFQAAHFAWRLGFTFLLSIAALYAFYYFSMIR